MIFEDIPWPRMTATVVNARGDTVTVPMVHDGRGGWWINQDDVGGGVRAWISMQSEDETETPE